MVRMRPLRLCITLLALALIPAGQANARSPRRHCPRAVPTVVANSGGEVYVGGSGRGQEYVACAFSAGRTYRLGLVAISSAEGAIGVPGNLIHLAGPYVAFEVFNVRPEQPGHWTVVVRNLRTGRLAHRLASGGGFVRDLVAKRDGSAAWIVAA